MSLRTHRRVGTKTCQLNKVTKQQTILYRFRETMKGVLFIAAYFALDNTEIAQH